MSASAINWAPWSLIIGFLQMVIRRSPGILSRSGRRYRRLSCHATPWRLVAWCYVWIKQHSVVSWYSFKTQSTILHDDEIRGSSQVWRRSSRVMRRSNRSSRVLKRLRQVLSGTSRVSRRSRQVVSHTNKSFEMSEPSIESWESSFETSESSIESCGSSFETFESNFETSESSIESFESSIESYESSSETFETSFETSGSSVVLHVSNFERASCPMNRERSQQNSDPLKKNNLQHLYHFSKSVCSFPG